MKKIDHILVRVNHLEKAIVDFKNMGFKVYKGSNKKSCHHAMIYFQDDSFLELIDSSKFPGIVKILAKSGVMNYMGILFQKFSHYTLSHERFLDYAVFTENIETFYKDSKYKKVSRLMNMKRKNHLGAITKWKLFAFKAPDLPFMMSEYDPFRFPGKNAATHDNGVLGIQEITIETPVSTKLYCSYFDAHLGTQSFDNTIKIGNTNIKIKPSKCYRISSVSLFSNTTEDKTLSGHKTYDISLVNHS